MTLISRWRRSTPSLGRILIALCFGVPLTLSAGSPHTKNEPYAFQVRITLSDKAAATLKRLDEGIVISASYSGDPKPSAKQHADEIGSIPLGVQNVEIPGRPATVIVSGSHVKRGRVAWIRGPVLLNVNAYSARRSGPDNILSCDFFDGRLRDATRRTVPIHCSLIEEKVETKHLS
ncbi:MAG TPA: hypothetical protein VGM02_14085 [Acidobacteriaceae bacterium]|jgi:hypothetical protein